MANLDLFETHVIHERLKNLFIHKISANEFIILLILSLVVSEKIALDYGLDNFAMSSCLFWKSTTDSLQYQTRKCFALQEIKGIFVLNFFYPKFIETYFSPKKLSKVLYFLICISFSKWYRFWCETNRLWTQSINTKVRKSYHKKKTILFHISAKLIEWQKKKKNFRLLRNHIDFDINALAFGDVYSLEVVLLLIIVGNNDERLFKQQCLKKWTNIS